MMWGAYVIGLLSSLFAYLYLRCKLLEFVSVSTLNFVIFLVTAPSYNASGQYTAPVLLFAFLIGEGLIALTLSSAIEAGVSTM